MNVFISTDMEGISGIVSPDEVMYSGRDYEMARRWMTADVNAAIEGALAAGATRIVVADPHWFQLNLIWSELHPKAELVKGDAKSTRPLLVLEGLDSSFDVALFVGFHAAGGLAPGVLNHTYMGTRDFFETRFNGEPIGEAKMHAGLTGYFGVPVGLVTGDDVTCNDMKSWAPEVETAIVKRAIDRYAAHCLPQETAHQLIREAAERAVRRAKDKEFKTFAFAKPTTVEVVVPSTSAAARMAMIPGAERTGHRSVSYTHDDLLEVYKVYVVMCLLALSAADPTY